MMKVITTAEGLCTLESEPGDEPLVRLRLRPSTRIEVKDQELPTYEMSEAAFVAAVLEYAEARGILPKRRKRSDALKRKGSLKPAQAELPA